MAALSNLCNNLYSASPTSQITTFVLSVLLAAEKPDTQILAQIDAVAVANGLKQWIAERVLKGLEVALNAEKGIGNAVREARDMAVRVMEAVEGFVKEHPVMVTVVALGVLVLLVPELLAALGFAELGIVEGSWAALWQARYAGYVPKGSLFSFFQRLGMVLHW